MKVTVDIVKDAIDKVFAENEINDDVHSIATELFKSDEWISEIQDIFKEGAVTADSIKLVVTFWKINMYGKIIDIKKYTVHEMYENTCILDELGTLFALVLCEINKMLFDSVEEV